MQPNRDRKRKQFVAYGQIYKVKLLPTTLQETTKDDRIMIQVFRLDKESLWIYNYSIIYIQSALTKTTLALISTSTTFARNPIFRHFLGQLFCRRSITVGTLWEQMTENASILSGATRFYELQLCSLHFTDSISWGETAVGTFLCFTKNLEC